MRDKRRRDETLHENQLKPFYRCCEPLCHNPRVIGEVYCASHGNKELDFQMRQAMDRDGESDL